MKILIVDDIPANVKVLQILCSRIGKHDIDCFTDSIDACHAVIMNSYDLILTDWMMPVISGEQIVKNARDSVANKNTPIAIVSAYAEDPTITECIIRNTRVCAHRKPTSKEILESIIKKAEVYGEVDN